MSFETLTKSNMEWLIPSEVAGTQSLVSNVLHPISRRFLIQNKDLFDNKSVVDLACHTGFSSHLICELGANRVVGVDIRKPLIESAREKYKGLPISFFVNDITNYGFIDALVSEANIVTVFGGFYHLTDNFSFLTHICADNVEYVIIETMFGTESQNAFLFPLFEDVELNRNGWHPKYKKVPIAQPNLSWIYQALNQIGFKLDYIEKYYSNTNWDTVKDFETNRRMILKMYNPRLISKTKHLEFDDIWEWNDEHKIHQCET